MSVEQMKTDEAALMETNKTTITDQETMTDKAYSFMIDKTECMKSEETMTDSTMLKKDEAMKKNESAMMDKAGVYTTYSDNSLAMAQKGRTVLFFHAGWCPTCRAADADITKNLSLIPAGVTILKTDYDTETALKQKYGVTTQHTFVEVDASGTLVQKWSGGNFAGITAKL